jgi:hypothetical protein
MSEQLKDFGAHAETLVEIPDFAELDRKGRALRVRRRAGVAAALAVVLAVAGVTVVQIHRTSVDHEPIKPPHTQTRDYKGATMKTLDPGTYRLHPSLIESDLTAELTLPPGWNSWIGPNRFDGHAPGRSNGQALDHLTWYVGALVLEVDGVNTRGCGNPTSMTKTPEKVVAALSRAFSMEMVRDPRQVHRFGYPATRMRLRVTHAFEDCGEANASVFHSTADGFIQDAYTGTILDVWVVDVDGTPIYVQRAWTPNAPLTARDELDSVIDSIRFKNAG